MRFALSVALALTACNGFFDDNPDFVDTESQTAGDGSTEAGADGSGTVGESGAPPPCMPDPYELNETDSSVAVIPDPPPGGAAGTIAATLEGEGAVDWYAFNGDEAGNGPRSTKATILDLEGARVCVYLKCMGGANPVVDCGAQEPVTSSGGVPGCCAIGQAIPTHECGGVPGGNVFAQVRVSDAQDRDECLPYTLEYRF